MRSDACDISIGSVSILFYSNETGEAPHIHVSHDAKLAKFCLQPVELGKSKGFAAHELTRIENLVSEHAQEFLEVWHEYVKD